VVHTLVYPCRSSSQIEAHLVGDGPARASCEQLVHQGGHADRMHFHGRISPEQVQPLLQRSQAILLMSDFGGRLPARCQLRRRARCSTQSRALVEAGYGAEQCIGRWLGVMEQQRGPARPPFPISASELRRWRCCQTTSC
jgi:hypothetical protein